MSHPILSRATAHLTAVACALPLALDAQSVTSIQTERVTWAIAPHAAGSGVQLTAQIAKGWHVYALTQRDEGPIPLRITLVGDSSVTAAGPVRGPVPQRFPTSPFGIPVVWYTNTARFTLPLHAPRTDATPVAQVAVRFQACSDSLCLPPKTIQLTQPLPTRVSPSRRGTTHASTTH